MILHVAGLDKFIPPLIKLIDLEFSAADHRFWLIGAIKDYPVDRRHGVYICGQSFLAKLCGYARLVLQMHAARKVILHGLFNVKLVIILALCPWLLPKCYWAIWGGDLYQYRERTSSWRSRAKEALRRFVISRIGHLISYVEGDVNLARQWYGANGVYHECLMYLSNVVDPALVASTYKQTKDRALNILLGNSADPSNNHIEALVHLLPYKDQEIRIFAPLSYGNKSHAQKVICQANSWFGDKFVPITDFMSLARYQEFLKSVDIAIFNHQRQQAMGNTITLLGMGKAVYLRSDVSQWDLFEKEEIKALDIKQFELLVLDSHTAAGNVEKVKRRFSRERLIEQYSEIFKK